VATPHISAQRGDFAEAVLLPGDPLRARFIADEFLDGARQVTSVRNMLAFTGVHRGMEVSVMGTGMGIPSASIYVTELIRDYGARRLVRVGSCGAIVPDVGLRDIVIAAAACTDSNVNRRRYRGWDFAAAADFRLVQAALEAASRHGVAARVGTVHSSDLFYAPDDDAQEVMAEMGVLAVEMEAAGIYGAAARFGARALAILTVSDVLDSGEDLTPHERERGFGEMVEIALDALHVDADRP